MLKAYNNNIILELVPLGEKTAGGIYLPEKKKDVPQKGIVLDSDVDDIKVGQTVLFRMWSGEGLKHEGKDIKIVHIKDIIAIEYEGEKQS